MTTAHTELCERLRTEIESFKKADIDPGELVPALAHIEELELEREQAVAEAHGYRARIAELEKERDALKAEAEGYRYIRAGRVYIEPQDGDGEVYVATSERGRYCKTADAFDAEIDAALQAEKETRS